MKTLNINISDDDFIKYNLQQSVLSFDELVAKIKAHTLKPNTTNTIKLSLKTRLLLHYGKIETIWQMLKVM